MTLAALLLGTLVVPAAETRFPLLAVGGRTYTNVTITTKATNYIFIVHAGGMESIKVSALSPQVRAQLGYGAPPAEGSAPTSGWAKELARMNTTQLRQLGRAWPAEVAAARARIRSLPRATLMGALAGAVLGYLFFCSCSAAICRKGGVEAGLLAWLPLVQFVPLLRAAGMPLWWFLLLLVPGLNLGVLLLWGVKICRARGKSGWLGALLVLPLVNLLPLAFLAFSSGTGAGAKKPPPNVLRMKVSAAR